MQHVKWTVFAAAALWLTAGSVARAGIPACLGFDSFSDAPPAFAADFESGDNGFVTIGDGPSLWHRTNACAVTLPSNPSQWAMYFGLSDRCDYDTGEAASGILGTGFLNLRGMRAPMTLAFRYFIETDGGAPFTDRLFVNVSNTQMSRVVVSNNQSADSRVCDPSGTWRIAIVDISDFAGFPMVSVGFSFDTIDDVDNGNAGLYIDDVRIYGARHDADQNGDGALSLSELLRVVQFFNAGGLHCAPNPGNSEDGFVPGSDPTAQTCTPHASDYNPPDWQISLSEVLRAVQFFNSSRFEACATGEDGYCPVL